MALFENSLGPEELCSHNRQAEEMQSRRGVALRAAAPWPRRSGGTTLCFRECRKNRKEKNKQQRRFRGEIFTSTRVRLPSGVSGVDCGPVWRGAGSAKPASQQGSAAKSESVLTSTRRAARAGRACLIAFIAICYPV